MNELDAAAQGGNRETARSGGREAVRFGGQETGGVGGRAARLAGVAGGAITAFGAVAAGVLAGQALIARRAIPPAESPPPRCDGEYSASCATGSPVRLAVVGDSTAAGYGVHTRAETPGALLAGWVAEATGRPVRLCCPAVVGAVSSMLPPQVDTAIEHGADLAIIMIGANDITSRLGQTTAVRHLFEAVRQLRAAGAQVVVATCPDLGTIEPIPPPLRWVARRWSRQLAAAQTIATVEAGGRTVSLGDLLGPEFSAAPDRMFGDDRYHPSVEGYALAAATILPTALAALGVPTTESGVPVDRAVRSLPAAAVAAVGHAGTEVSAVRVDGDERGPRGRWAQLRQRVRAAVGPAPVNGSTGTGTPGATPGAEAAPGGPDAVPSLAGRQAGIRPGPDVSTVEIDGREAVE
jgi:lysophospholipase L1-like esterase